MKFRNFITEKAEDLGNFALRKDKNFVYLYNNDEELLSALDGWYAEAETMKILFVFELGKDDNIEQIVAQKGYGPIAYKVAMSSVDWLGPSENSRLSKQAEKVWDEFNSGKGQNDVIKKYDNIDSINGQKFKIKKKVQTKKNEKNHESVLKIDNDYLEVLDKLARKVLSAGISSIY